MTEWLVDRRQEFGFFDFDNEAYIRELLAKQENNNG